MKHVTILSGQTKIQLSPAQAYSNQVEEYMLTVNGQSKTLQPQQKIILSQQERITTWDSNVLARIGSHVELRCEDLVDGVVVPGVWAGHGDTGGLRLTDLRWEDMGVYTCITQQGERDTFLYPYTP